MVVNETVKLTNCDFWEKSAGDAFSKTGASVPQVRSMECKLGYILKWSSETCNTTPGAVEMGELNDGTCIHVKQPGVYKVDLVLFLSAKQINTRPDLMLKLDEMTVAHSNTTTDHDHTNFIRLQAYFRSVKIASDLKVFLLQPKPERSKSPQADLSDVSQLKRTSINPLISSPRDLIVDNSSTRAIMEIRKLI